MWLFTTKGFFSIVQHKDDPDCLLVRARVKGDIEQHWPYAKIQKTEDADYLYRAKIPREAVQSVLHEIVKNINYTSYKGASGNKKRYWGWYSEVDSLMRMMQEHYNENRKTEDISGG